MGFPPSIHDQGRESSVRFRPFGSPNVAQWQRRCKKKTRFPAVSNEIVKKKQGQRITFYEEMKHRY